MKKTVRIGALILVLIVLAAMHALSRQTERAALTGPYLGQKPPGMTSEFFAPGIVSTRADEYGLEVSVDGNEIIFVRGGAIMLAARILDGPWEPPAVAPFSGEHTDDGKPCCCYRQLCPHYRHNDCNRAKHCIGWNALSAGV